MNHYVQFLPQQAVNAVVSVDAKEELASDSTGSIICNETEFMVMVSLMSVWCLVLDGCHDKKSAFL